MAQAAVDQAAARSCEQARANLAGAALTAPYGGRGRRPRRPPSGSRWAAGWPWSPWWTPARCASTWWWTRRTWPRCSPGRTVNLTFDALPGQRVPGTVAVVAPTAPSPRAWSTTRCRSRSTRPRRRASAPGMTATAQIVTAAARTTSCSVPNRALRTQGRTRTVEVLEADGKTSTRPGADRPGQRPDDRGPGRAAAGRPGGHPGHHHGRRQRPRPRPRRRRPGGPGGPGGGPVIVQRPGGGGRRRPQLARGSRKRGTPHHDRPAAAHDHPEPTTGTADHRRRRAAGRPHRRT